MAGDNDKAALDSLERLGLAALGFISLTAERADALADELARAGGMRRDEAREVVQQATHRWRGDVARASERAGSGLEGVFRQLGIVSRSELEELELRLAQLEHRLGLLEAADDANSAPPATTEPT